MDDLEGIDEIDSGVPAISAVYHAYLITVIRKSVKRHQGRGLGESVEDYIRSEKSK